MTLKLPAEIFKAYDIRGIVGKTLTPEICRAVGQALGSLARERQQAAIAVGRDGRLSGPELSGALMQGITEAGVDAIDVGCVPTPLTYFAAYELGCHSCVSVTGSHNPPDYNGLKMVIGGETLALDAIQQLKARIEAGNLLTWQAQALAFFDQGEMGFGVGTDKTHRQPALPGTGGAADAVGVVHG